MGPGRSFSTVVRILPRERANPLVLNGEAADVDVGLGSGKGERGGGSSRAGSRSQSDGDRAGRVVEQLGTLVRLLDTLTYANRVALERSAPEA